MNTLTIQWQRLLDQRGQTCERCGATEKEVQKAFHGLRQSLAPLGIELTLEKKALGPVTCAKDPSQSNRVFVGGRALEEWLDAHVGQSPCATCCEELGDDVECRTIAVEGRTYESIPADLIVKAGVLAASQMLTVQQNEPPSGDVNAAGAPPGGCCPRERE